MKREVIEALKANKDQFISGAALSRLLGVSRTAVWKVIQQLKDEGYKIESVSRKGYRLMEDADRLDADALMAELGSDSLIQVVKHFDSIDSTNTYAKQVATEDAAEGMLIIAEEQLTGRGRLGRQWSSPKGTGVWMSLILRPDIDPREASKITQIGAAAMAEAIEDITGLPAGIKWPNDIIVSGKKVCGILTEMSAELNTINYVVVGIGVNVNTPSFPEDLKPIATSLYQESEKMVSRKSLVRGFAGHFTRLYGDFLSSGALDMTREICLKRSVTVGRDVRIIHRGVTTNAHAVDIDPNGELVVDYEDGRRETIFYGEVSVRARNGYI